MPGDCSSAGGGGGGATDSGCADSAGGSVDMGAEGMSPAEGAGSDIWGGDGERRRLNCFNGKTRFDYHVLQLLEKAY